MKVNNELQGLQSSLEMELGPLRRNIAGLERQCQLAEQDPRAFGQLQLEMALQEAIQLGTHLSQAQENSSHFGAEASNLTIYPWMPGHMPACS